VRTSTETRRTRPLKAKKTGATSPDFGSDFGFELAGQDSNRARGVSSELECPFSRASLPPVFS
jgi:hypothetical protein